MKANLEYFVKWRDRYGHEHRQFYGTMAGAWTAHYKAWRQGAQWASFPMALLEGRSLDCIYG